MNVDRRLLLVVLILGLLVGGSGGFLYGKNLQIQNAGQNVVPATSALVMEVNSISGTITEIKENSFILEAAPSALSVSLSASRDREVIVGASSKIVRNDYQSKTGGFKEVVMKLSDLKIGDSVSVDTKEDISNKSFEAVRVFVRTAPPSR